MDDKVGINIDAIFNMHKIKFTDLDTFIPDYIKHENPQKVRVFINLEVVYRYIICVKGEEALLARNNMDDTKKMFISNVINLAQHYRLYFAKMRIPNEIYLFWNYNPDNDDYKNSEFISNYREKYDNKIGNLSPVPYVRDVIKESLKTLQTLVKYVNEVYLITHNTIESSVIPYMFYRDQPDDIKHMNILISRDLYDYQYALYDFYVIDPKKLRVIVKNNLLDIYSTQYKRKTKIDIPLNFVPTMMALLGDSNKGIPKIKSIGINGLSNIIKENINNLRVTENTSSLDIIEKMFDDDVRQDFRNNYKCTSIPQQYQELTPKERFEIFSQVIDKYDDISLEYLNDRFFTNHLLMIVDSRSQQIMSEGIIK